MEGLQQGGGFEHTHLETPSEPESIKIVRIHWDFNHFLIPPLRAEFKTKQPLYVYTYQNSGSFKKNEKNDIFLRDDRNSPGVPSPPPVPGGDGSRTG